MGNMTDSTQRPGILTTMTTSTPEHFVLERWRDLPIEFDGEILADLSSREDDSVRWQEIRIYRTTSNKFVTEVIGRTTCEDEHDIIRVMVWRRPGDVRKGLLRRSEERAFYTDLAVEALEIAAETVPDIYDAADPLTELI